MATPLDTKHLKMLMYRFGAREVANHLGVKNERDLLAWIDQRITPTEEQVSRLVHADTTLSAVQANTQPVATAA